MGKLKIWQVLVLVLGLAALGYLGYSMMSGGSGAKWANEALGVDIETGQIYSFSLGKKAAVFPATNPDTGRRTIYPVSQDESGAYFVSTRYLEGIENMDIDPKAVADRSSGRINAKDDQIIRVE